MKPGIYDKWSDAHAQVYRFPSACYKGYDSRKVLRKPLFRKMVRNPKSVIKIAQV